MVCLGRSIDAQAARAVVQGVAFQGGDVEVVAGGAGPSAAVRVGRDVLQRDREPGHRVVAGRCDESFLADSRTRTANRLAPIFNEHPELFTRLRSNAECTLYRIDAAKLRELYPTTTEGGGR